jgi:hypothetical protein
MTVRPARTGLWLLERVDCSDVWMLQRPTSAAMT